MTPPDMTHAEGFLNFRNKRKRLQQNSSRSLCGLASSQYERVHSAHTHKKNAHWKDEDRRKEGACSVIPEVAHHSISLPCIFHLPLSSHKMPSHL